jgi:thiocyanate desulfurase
MNEVQKPTTTTDTPRIDLIVPLAPEANLPAKGSQAQVDTFLARRAEVERSDHDEFREYLREKQARARAARAEVQPSVVNPSTTVTRRGMIKVAAGTAIVGESAVLGYNAIQSGALGALGIGGETSFGPSGQGNRVKKCVTRQ